MDQTGEKNLVTPKDKFAWNSFLGLLNEIQDPKLMDVVNFYWFNMDRRWKLTVSFAQLKDFLWSNSRECFKLFDMIPRLALIHSYRQPNVETQFKSQLILQIIMFLGEKYDWYTIQVTFLVKKKIMQYQAYSPSLSLDSFNCKSEIYLLKNAIENLDMPEIQRSDIPVEIEMHPAAAVLFIFLDQEKVVYRT